MDKSYFPFRYMLSSQNLCAQEHLSYLYERYGKNIDSVIVAYTDDLINDESGKATKEALEHYCQNSQYYFADTDKLTLLDDVREQIYLRG